MIGRSLGHYEIIELLGAGGMGEVYRARDRKLGRDIALKVLPTKLAENEQLLERLKREARLLACINHPHIAAIFSLDEADGVTFLVLELVEGETLARHLERKQLSVEQALRICRQVAEALEAAHEKEIIHRDLKPANVMVSAKGRVKVLDFGIAKGLRPAGGDESTFAAGLTATGVLVGTVPYMSPEQVRGEPAGRRSDVWAFGCLLYEALTGRRAFDRETPADTMAAIIDAEPDWETLPVSTPDGIRKLLLRALQKKADRRARDMWHIRLELDDALGELAEPHRQAVHCLQCGRENRTDSRFCSQCGAELRISCPRCDAETRPGTIFCSECGARLEGDDDPVAEVAAIDSGMNGISLAEPAKVDAGDSDALATSERRQVTVIVSRLPGYGALLERLDPRDVDDLMERMEARLSGIAEAHGGVLNRFGGEEIVVAFGVPTAHEDHFLRAVRAARQMHEAVGQMADEEPDRIGDVVGLHTAINTGAIVAQSREQSRHGIRLVGETLQLAERLVVQAGADEILVSPEARRLIAPFFETEELEPLTMPGRSGFITPYRVVAEAGLETRMEAAEITGLTPFAGRASELETLRSCLQRALDGEGHFVTVAGDAGAGKSRLLYELCHSEPACQDQVTVMRGRCRLYGHSPPYLPFIAALRDAVDLRPGGQAESAETIVGRIRDLDPELEQFAALYLHLLSIHDPEHAVPEDLSGDEFGVALVEALAALFTLSSRDTPVVMLMEDWHWADEASEQVLEQIAGMVSAYPMLVVVTYRPDRSFDWSTAANRTPIQLGPLEQSATSSIMEALLGVESVPSDLASLVRERTGGNPFFVEELCQTMVEEGLVRVEAGQVKLSGKPAQLHLPDTVQAVIHARLDRLDRDAREVLRVASVVGREFTRRVLELTLPGRIDLPASLDNLKAPGLIQQIRVVPDAVYRFKHAVTQDVAYESLLQHQRKALHGVVGEAIEELHPDRIEELLDVLAKHFGEAENWGKAVRYGLRAAQRARNLSQFAEVSRTLDLVRGWLSRLPDEEERRELLIELLLLLESACEALGEIERQQKILDELLDLLGPGGERPELAEAHLRKGEMCTLSGRFEEAEESLNRSLETARRLSDPIAQRRAHRSLGFLRWHQGRVEEALESAEQALALSRESGDRTAISIDLQNLVPLLRRCGELDRALSCAEEAFDLADPETLQRSSALWQAASVLWDMGEADQALEHFEEGARIARRASIPIQRSIQLIATANIYWRQGHLEEALELFLEALELNRKYQTAMGLSQSLRGAGEICLAMNRRDEALPYLQEGAEIYRRLEDGRGEAQMWSKVARIHELDGDLAAAAAAWRRVRELEHRHGDDAGQVDALEGLARATRTDNPELALGCLKEALELAERDDDHARQGDLLNTMGIIEWNRANAVAALSHYERALLIFQQLDDEIHAGLVLNSMGVVLKDMKRYDDARSRLEKALTFHRRTGEKLLEGHALAALGDLDSELANPQDAAEHYKASLSIRREIGDRVGEGWMLQRLAGVRAAEGLERQARELAGEAGRIAEETGDEKLVDAVSRLAVD